MYERRAYRPKADITTYELAKAVSLVMESGDDHSVVLLPEEEWAWIDRDYGRHFDPIENQELVRRS